MTVDGARETSSATTRLVLRHVRETRGDAAVQRVVAAAGVPESLAQLEDDREWVSYATRIALFEAIAAEYGDRQVLFDVGASILHHSVSPGLAVLLRALGSPAQVYRSVPRAVAKFSTTSTMKVLEVGSAHATVDFRLHEGYAHSALDCLYAQGLLSTVPTLFGLPAARVVHPECEQDGAPACRYHLTWTRFSRWRRTRQESAEAADLRAQLEALQSAAAEITASDDVATVLRRIVDRAATSVLAQAFLLVVTATDGGQPVVEALGVPAHRQAELAARLLAGDDLGPSAVVVDVASSRRTHGRLAALYSEGQRGLPDERRLLAAYAGHAAAALDLVSALSDSRRDEERARALLGLSHELARATSTEHVSELVAKALPRVVGCDSAGLLLWHPADGELRVAYSVGLTEERYALLRGTPLRPQDTPELTQMLTDHRPMVVSASSAQPALQALLGALDIEHMVAVPLLAGEELLGVATASWGTGPAPAERTQDLTLRLQGVADQAATALRNAQLLATVQHQALHDSLTGLPNRVLLADRLEQAVASSGAAVLFCDLDRFKQVNDALGHAAGDELLRQVAARLRLVLDPTAAVGRLSGDEFAVLLPGADLAHAEAVAGAVVDCFARPFRLDGREVRVTTSVGVACSGRGASTPERLLGAADGAMYTAKQRGRNQVSTSCSDDDVPAAEGPSLVQELRDALLRDELRLVFQPVVSLPDRTSTAVEALVRWQHPRLGQLPPSDFLPLAEEAGLVVDLDLWVLRTAACTVAAWTDGPATLAVNLSSATLADPRLLPAARAALSASGLAPSRLTVEVVESRSLVDLPGVVDRLVALRRLGVRIALDDFGTGFSTLSLLQQLPADVVKIDRSFVAALGADETARSLVRGVLALAAALQLEVVAEGVETEEQLAVLQDEGCVLVQGYLLGRPAPAPAVQPGGVEACLAVPPQPVPVPATAAR
ncbi:MAG: Diguanylate cyclase protein [Frankiales bacterium]|nr:Diguanylate cyclase protein [Frankiales bacterium]